jgi:hypothetical protein
MFYLTLATMWRQWHPDCRFQLSVHAVYFEGKKLLVPERLPWCLHGESPFSLVLAEGIPVISKNRRPPEIHEGPPNLAESNGAHIRLGQVRWPFVNVRKAFGSFRQRSGLLGLPTSLVPLATVVWRRVLYVVPPQWQRVPCFATGVVPRRVPFGETDSIILSYAQCIELSFMSKLVIENWWIHSQH